MKRILLGTLLYTVATFATQATSHFGINRAHYAAVGFLRPEPIFALGFASMLLQGAVLTHLYGRYTRENSGWRQGWKFALLAGTLIVSYEALAEPAKYPVPSVVSWMLVEAAAGFVQFSLFGLALGWALRRPEHALPAAS
ncbi:MAG: hypothetical protein HY302_12015 [Opitutae bacterium]|nr:hypothetical protein [Opitutae bacterium]